MFDLISEPEACDECDVCTYGANEIPGLKLLRCSACKNRFYCVRGSSARTHPYC
jgi:hypothetical protein